MIDKIQNRFKEISKPIAGTLKKYLNEDFDIQFLNKLNL